jgi:hypothetical protein
MVVIMSLLASATVTNDGILLTNRASSGIDSIVTVGVPLAKLAFPKIRTRGRAPHLPSKDPDWKRITSFDWHGFLCND